MNFLFFSYVQSNVYNDNRAMTRYGFPKISCVGRRKTKWNERGYLEETSTIYPTRKEIETARGFYPARAETIARELYRSESASDIDKTVSCRHENVVPGFLPSPPSEQRCSSRDVLNLFMQEKVSARRGKSLIIRSTNCIRLRGYIAHAHCDIGVPTDRKSVV